MRILCRDFASLGLCIVTEKKVLIKVERQKVSFPQHVMKHIDVLDIWLSCFNSEPGGVEFQRQVPAALPPGRKPTFSIDQEAI
jgi:hypothetical protein